HRCVGLFSLASVTLQPPLSPLFPYTTLFRSFAGLALSALLPTSGMTISWTVLQKGNVGAAVKLTVFGLILGSLLTPWYLLAMVRSEEHTSELQSRFDLVCRLLLEKKNAARCS